MVYNGRPSTGCESCKRRRRKCDEAWPYCLNCRKTGQQCPGTPDPLSLMFKNETLSVTCKATRTSKGGKLKRRRGACESRSMSKISSSSLSENVDPAIKAQKNTKNTTNSKYNVLPNSSTLGLFIDRHWIDDYDPTSTMIFNPCIEQQATNFFFNNFVLSPRSEGHSRDFLGILIPMFECAASASPLMAAIKAISVRATANFAGGRNMHLHAERLYGKALRGVQCALQYPEHATSDETLLSILLFSLYESISQSSVDTWSKHVQGAVSIVKLRGTNQFANPNSLLLFRATRTQMLIHAIQRREAIQYFPGPNGWLSDQVDGQDKSLIEYSIRLPNVLAKAKKLLLLDRCPKTIRKIRELLHDAYSLQNELFGLDVNMSPQFGYRSVLGTTNTLDDAATEIATISSGIVHIYRDVQSASMRNNIRVSQLLCLSLVIDSLKWLDPNSYVNDRQYKAAVYRIQYTVDDIVASVPFHLGYRLTENGAQSEEPGDHNAVSTIGGYFLIWPLYVCSQIAEIPEPQRVWLRGKLRLIAERHGLKEGDVARARAGGSWNQEISFDKGGSRS